MNNDFVVTTRKEGVNQASGKIVKETGYTFGNQRAKTATGAPAWVGPPEIEIEDSRCYAKLVEIDMADKGGESKKMVDTIETYKKFFLKIGLDGHIFDPWGFFSEGTENQRDRRRDKKKWEFKEVGEICFNNYLKFLESRNKAWLNNAEREI